ncbi:MAG: hypothetical protein R6V08_07780 [Desulfuromonadales bacterium]
MTLSGGSDKGQTQCPHCDSGDYYNLADGRRKCRSCRKKYTSRFVRLPLGEEFRREASRLFWEMVPARQAAPRLGINRKTMQRYYGMMRYAIGRKQEDALALIQNRDLAARPDSATWGSLSIVPRHPVFWFYLLAEHLLVSFPEDEREFLQIAPPPPQGVLATGVVYASQATDFERLLIDRFHQKIWWCEGQPLERDHRRVERFWVFARDRLRHYRGGYQDNFSLFVQEMAFRFSQKNPEKVLSFLRRSLENEVRTDQNIAMKEKKG